MAVRDWADISDNRLGPILAELAAAVEDTTNDETLRQIANRLKFMSGAVHSQRHRLRKSTQGDTT